ncbi:tetratricopeptide repeat protein [Brucella pseudogrignonensis]|uniref:tetratricopeptide repeat protein n=1 Tax=Brucella pseudogrignonensis TaxID=419475 RepID=UPI003ECEB47A
MSNKKNNGINQEKITEHQSHVRNLKRLFDARKNEPHNIDITMEIVSVLKALSRVDEQIGLLTEAVKRHPKDPRFHYHLGRVFREKGEHEKSLKYFQESLKLKPNSTIASIAVAKQLVHMGNYDDARMFMGKFYEVNISKKFSVNERKKIAEIYLNVKLFDCAINYYDIFIADSKRNLMAFLYVVDQFSRRSLYSMAYLFSQQAIKEIPSSPDLWIAHLDIQANILNDDELELSLSEALNLTNNHVSITNHAISYFKRLAHIAKSRGTNDNCVYWLRKCLEMQPNNFDLHLYVADEIKYFGLDQEMRGVLESAIKLNPQAIKPYFLLGGVERNSGALAAALRYYEKCYSLNPKSQIVAIALIETLFLAKKSHIARQKLVQLISDTEKIELSPVRKLKIAELCIKAGLYDVAFEVLLELVEAGEVNTKTMRYLIKILTDTKRFIEALDLVNKFLVRFPHEILLWRSYLQISGKLLSPEQMDQVISEVKKRTYDDKKILYESIKYYKSIGMLEKLTSELVCATKIYPHDFGIKRLWIESLIENGDLKTAQAVVDSINANSDKEDSILWFLRSKIADAEWKLDEAVEYALQAEKKGDDNVSIQMHLARLHIKRLQPETAKRSLLAISHIRYGALKGREKSVNITQSLTGEMMNEFLVDTDALKFGRNAINTGNLDNLITASTTYPDATSVAVALLIKLRQDGFFDRSDFELKASTNESRVPRVITQYWDTEDVPDDVLAIMKSWTYKNPSWDYQRFSHETARKYLLDYGDLTVYRAYMMGKSAAQKADIFRLARLFYDGGVYADCDDRCNTALDSLLHGYNGVFWQEQFGTIGNNFIAVERESPLIGEALDRAVLATTRGDSESIWFSTGPGLISRVLANYFGRSIAAIEEGFSKPFDWREIKVVNRHELRRFVICHCQTSYKALGTHWSEFEFGAAGQVVQGLQETRSFTS